LDWDQWSDKMPIFRKLPKLRQGFSGGGDFRVRRF
jgi:hypothetical protein